MNNSTRTQTHIMNNHIAITMKTPCKASHRKGHITVVKVITEIGLQKTELVTWLITQKETSLMIIALIYGMED